MPTRLLCLFGALVPIIAFVLNTSVVFAQQPPPSAEALQSAFPAQKQFSPNAGRNYPTRVFWGDTHLHTSFSMDAGAFGARINPRDAYRFATGQEITASSGQQAKLSRPLDFLVVADHSDGMGFFPLVFAGGPSITADAQGRKWHEMILSGQGALVRAGNVTGAGQRGIVSA